MKILVSQIQVPSNRQRSEFSEAALQDLASSVKRLGLLQPLVVRQDTSHLGVYLLVAGERRLRAIQTLNWTEVEVNLLESLDPIDAFEAELEENIRRVDLSMADRVRAVSQLHHLRNKQAIAAGGRQTFSATAQEISGKAPTQQNVEDVRDSLVIAQHLSDPDIARAQTTKEAIKLIRKKLETAQRAELAKHFNPSSTPHCPWHGDTYRVLPTLNEGQYDCILTDPPYGIDASDFGSQAKATHDYADDAETFNQLLTTFPELAFRLLKPQGHLYLFCDFRWFERLRLAFELAGFDAWPKPLIWAKNGGMLPEPDYGPRYSYECILFANKGRRRTLKVASDVIACALVAQPRFGAEKPAPLFAELLSRTCLPGDSVLDPFMGTGPIFPAANIVKCTAHGIELIEEKYNLAITRVNEHPTEIIL